MAGCTMSNQEVVLPLWLQLRIDCPQLDSHVSGILLNLLLSCTQPKMTDKTLAMPH